MLNDPNFELKEREGRCCDVYNPNGCLCPSTLVNTSNHVQKEATEEEKEEGEEKEPEWSDWNADLEEAQDYHARVSAPIWRPRLPTKVLMFQPCKCPGWLAS